MFISSMLFNVITMTKCVCFIFFPFITLLVYEITMILSSFIIPECWKQLMLQVLIIISKDTLLVGNLLLYMT